MPTKPCGGWPFGTGCLTIIEDEALLCSFHERSRQRWHDANDPEWPEATTGSSWEPVAKTLAEMDPMPTCLCGGYRDAAGHEQSLLHIAYTNHKSWEGRTSQEREQATSTHRWLRR